MGRRFDKVKHDPALFLKYWVIQGLWVFITLVPTITMNMSKRNPALGVRDYLGWAIWGLGFLIEVVADMQVRLQKRPSQRGTVHLFWPLERFATSQLLWGNTPLVRPLPGLQCCLQRLAISQSCLANFCHASHHSAVWCASP